MKVFYKKHCGHHFPGGRVLKISFCRYSPFRLRKLLQAETFPFHSNGIWLNSCLILITCKLRNISLKKVAEFSIICYPWLLKFLKIRHR